MGQVTRQVTRKVTRFIDVSFLTLNKYHGLNHKLLSLNM